MLFLIPMTLELKVFTFHDLNFYMFFKKIIEIKNFGITAIAEFNKSNRDTESLSDQWQ